MRRNLILCIIAFTLSLQAGGIRVLFEYDEPTVNSDGTPLTDLAKTSIYYDIVGDAIITPKILVDIAATKPGGGGHITKFLVIPLSKNKFVEIDFHVTATDKTGNESNKSLIVRKFMGYINQ